MPGSLPQKNPICAGPGLFCSYRPPGSTDLSSWLESSIQVSGVNRELGKVLLEL